MSENENKHPLFTSYVRTALRHAKYQILPSTGTFYGEIPGFNGVYAETDTLEECRDELREVLEEWLLLRFSRNLLSPD